MADNRIIIEALKEKKAKLQEEIALLDAHIKQLQGKDINPAGSFARLTGIANISSADGSNGKQHVLHLNDSIALSDNATTTLSRNSQTKSEVLSIFDRFNRPLKMSEIQEVYMENKPLSDFHVRETVRSLNNTGLVKLMKINKSNRNAYWVKTEWVDRETKILKNEYKWEGFDLLYSADELEFL